MKKLFLLTGCVAACAAAAALAPLAEAPNPLWFWNDRAVNGGALTGQMRMLQKAGYGGLSILPFGGGFQPSYLTDDYFHLYGACVDEARRLGLQLWLYDEYGFPSGSAGFINGDGRSRFAETYPDLVSHRLDKAERTVKGGERAELSVGPGTLMAAVALETATFERLDLAAHVADGCLAWTAPAGTWKVMLFTCVKGEPIMDYLDPAAAQAFIDLTHEAYYRRMKDAFGSVIVGTFFDEPTLYRNDGRCWTPSFNARFEQQYGSSPARLYPALWYDIGPATAEARNLLFGFRTELYARAYFKAVSDWSAARGIHATGHQDNEEVVNPVGTSGDLMKCFKYQEMPGIDKIGGDRPAERFYKVVSSAAHNWDHPLVMSETYGAMGNIPWSQIYDIAMDQYTKGINVLIPHAVWYDDCKVVFPPELSPRSPIYGDELPAFNAFLARLNAHLRFGRTACSVAVLYPIASAQADHRFDGPLTPYQGGVALPYLDYTRVGTTLTDELGVDFEFLHPEVLEQNCGVYNGQIALSNKSQPAIFRALVIPSSTTISRTVLERARVLQATRGQVVFTGTLPTRGTRAADDAAVRQLVAELLAQGARHVKEVSAPALAEALRLDDLPRPVVFHGPALRNIFRTDDRRFVWYFANPSPDPVETEVFLRGRWTSLVTLDPHTDRTAPAVSRTVDGGVRVKLSLAPHRSVLLKENK